MNGNIIELSYSCFVDCSHFLIWYEDENSKDRVYTSGGKVVSFWKEEEARLKAEKLGINVTETCFSMSKGLITGLLCIKRKLTVIF